MSIRIATALVASMLVALIAPASVAADRQARVVNGTEVDNPDAPYMAFITVDGFACGGSLIHPSWVLTAGHCVTEGSGANAPVYAAGEFTIEIGREDRNDSGDGEVRGVSQVVRHPNYDNVTLANDVALLRLSVPSTQPVIRLANAAQTSFEAVGTDVIVQGYGLTSDGSASAVLLETDLEVNTNASCGAASLGGGTMCAGDLQNDPSADPENDSCNGDSGGPLVHDDPVLGRRQVGTVSYGPSACGFEQGDLDAGGYGRLSFFEDFIHDNVGIMAFVDDLTATEGTSGTNTTFAVPVSLSRAPEGTDLTGVTLSTAFGSATAADFTAVTDRTLTFTGTDRATLPVQVTADGLTESSESFAVVQGSTSAIPVVRSGTVTIVDDDNGIPAVDVTASDVIEGDSGTTTMTVTATLSAPATGTETIRVRSDGGTATSGTDYLALDETITFGAGQTTQTRSLAVVGDTDVERDESITLDVQLLTDVATGGTTRGGTILDDDRATPKPLTVDVRTSDAIEGDTGTSPRTLTASLSGPAAGDETVRIRATGGTATAGTDFVAFDEVLTFEAGTTTAAVDLAVIGDRVIEPDETITFTVTSDEVDVRVVEDTTIVNDDVRVIERRAGSDRIATALATSASRADDSAMRVYLASSTSYPDALVGTPLAHRDGAPLLLTPPDGLDGRVLTEIRRVLAPGGRVRLLGGTVALSTDVASALTGAGIANDRIAGETRFETATRVADELGDVDLVLLATGRNFPDALAAGAAAAATNGAVLLTDDRTLPPDTAAWLDRSPAAEAAVGGAAAAARPSATPLVGADRYATAALVAQRYLPDAIAIGLASGTNFPDALAGGVEIAALGGALLLTAPDQLSPAAADRIRSSKPTIVLLFGGLAALDTTVESTVRALLR